MSGFQNPRVWDYIAVNAKNEIEAGGWYNSFDGEVFSREEMNQYVENTFKKLEIFLEPNKNEGTAVEIGCASGLTMFRMAPYFQRYIGTDMAKVNLQKNAEIIAARNIHNIELIQCQANEIQDLLSQPKWLFEGAEMIIMNSVCQYFPDYDYLAEVVVQGLKILKPGGIFYIGDVLDKEKLNVFKEELLKFQLLNPDKKVNVERKGELWISKDYFWKLEELEVVENVIISDKIFRIENELTRYRYDVVIKKQGNRDHLED